MFYTSISGLNAFRQQLAVISDNIANSQTTAFKGGGVSFAEVLSTSSATSPTANVGNGVAVQDMSVGWTQGTTSNTGNANDFAITGSGFFIVTDTDGLTSYTRDGQFSYNNAEGNLINSSGMIVQGYSMDTGIVGDITISSTPIPATQTTLMTTTANLNSSAAIGATSTFSTTANTYDSLGNSIPLTITYVKLAANSWSWAAAIPLAMGSATGSGTLTFNSDGELTAGAGGTPGSWANPLIALDLNPGSGGTDHNVTWNLYTATASNGNLTQLAASQSSLFNVSQNGTASGQLKSISTDSTGIITASYSNGETIPMFQIALADFQNYDGLNKTGNNLYRPTSALVSPTIGIAGTGKFGTLAAGSLETSNVDMAKEMANMILAQRSYESCARMFTTESEMLQTTVNMGK